MREDLKIAIISTFSGLVRRGAETLAEQLKTYLEGDSKIFSLVATDSNIKVNGIYKTDALYNLIPIFLKLTRKTKLYKLQRYMSGLEIFDETSLIQLSFAINLYKKLKEFSPNIIFNIAGTNVGSILRLYRKIHKTPFISIGGGGIGLTDLKNAKTKPDAYIAQTPSKLKWLKERVSDVRIELIPCGVDFNLFSPNGKKFTFEDIRQLSYLPNPIIERPLILSASALESNKRLDFLINAIYKLNKGTLIFAGDGKEKEKLIMLGKSLLGRRFVYLGALNREDTTKIFNTCDLFCLPSLNEPFGTVLLEAMASGIPVVTNDDEDRRWIVGDGGVLVDVRDLNKLTWKIDYALNKDWGDIPCKQVEKFSLDIVIKMYSRLIEDILF